MKIFILLLLLLPPIFVISQADLLPGKTWKVTELNTVFLKKNINLYHKDSALNELDFSLIEYKFFADSTYKKYYLNDSSYIGHWSLNSSKDSAYIDFIPFKLIQLDHSNFITRGYSIQLADNAGLLDTAFSFFKLNLVTPPVLPVNLVSFRGTLTDNVVHLTWVTSQEINSHHFEILKSADGVSFTTTGTVPAKGNSAVSNRYQFSDLQFIEGINYYRLKQVDVDGRFTWSNIIAINVDGKKNVAISIYPNPAKSNLTFFTRTTQHGTWQLSIKNMYGQSIFNQLIQPNVQTMQLQLPTLAKGIYTAEIIDRNGKRIYSGKLILQ